MSARIQLRQAEDGRRYWWGADTSSRGETELGEGGVLKMNATHFQVGSVLTLDEPLEPDREAIDE